mmetsp:Transcript_24827/g.68133  ORF Transcript_24827/g.68133 Transcript_24827/m.68133 type:complete len:91 (+) Transcript_24827:1075-1347(+)
MWCLAHLERQVPMALMVRMALMAPMARMALASCMLHMVPMPPMVPFMVLPKPPMLLAMVAQGMGRAQCQHKAQAPKLATPTRRTSLRCRC